MTINRVIISGGGTGGHVYPALAIADELKNTFPKVDILFIGAIGRMEMEKVPAAGYPIKGLKIAGFNRASLLKNIGLPWKIFVSLWNARKIISSFQPDLVIGVGGYASGPTLKMANWLRIPTIIQEQNSFPGKTNLLLAKKAKAICVAYSNMNRFFPKEKIFLTGNPVRQDILDISAKKTLGLEYHHLHPYKKTVLVIGGSLGARSLNQAMFENFDFIASLPDVQFLWQCGGYYHPELAKLKLPKNVVLRPFLDRMDLAYAAADFIVSRAGATSISELAIIGKPCILVPSPNVSEDHQTKNAEALSSKNAAILVKDSEASKTLIKWVSTTLENPEQLSLLSSEIRKLSLPNATKEIVQICLNQMKK